jgi:hypothetical protein
MEPYNPDRYQAQGLNSAAYRNIAVICQGKSTGFWMRLREGLAPPI